MAIETVDLERGMPTAEQALIRLDQAIRSAKQKRLHTLKIIHGYGSSGKGGAIKRETRSFLAARKRSGGIRGFVGGEHFSPFDADARAIITAEPALSRDPAYARGNAGITIVLL